MRWTSPPHLSQDFLGTIPLPHPNKDAFKALFLNLVILDSERKRKWDLWHFEQKQLGQPQQQDAPEPNLSDEGSTAAPDAGPDVSPDASLMSDTMSTGGAPSNYDTDINSEFFSQWPGYAYNGFQQSYDASYYFGMYPAPSLYWVSAAPTPILPLPGPRPTFATAPGTSGPTHAELVLYKFDKTPWYDPFITGVDINVYDSPRLGPWGNMNASAIRIVESIPVWKEEHDLLDLARSVVWKAIEPRDEFDMGTQQAKDKLKRIVEFVRKIKNAFRDVRKDEKTAQLFGDLVSRLSVTLFEAAWTVGYSDPKRNLISDYSEAHVQSSLRLALFVTELYNQGFATHIKFKNLLFNVIAYRLKVSFDYVLALNLLLTVEGKFWAADFYHHTKNFTHDCTSPCKPLLSSGFLTEENFAKDFLKFKHDKVVLFYQNVRKGTCPKTGEMTSALPGYLGGKAPTEVVLNEMKWMSDRLLKGSMAN